MPRNKNSSAHSSGAMRAAGMRLLDIYADLATRNAHLLGTLLAGQTPRQWAHYPENDAIDLHNGFQWFYHSHAPEDRVHSGEHGHIHLFAQQKRWLAAPRSARKSQHIEFFDESDATIDTRHLLCVGFDAKGVPASLFTVNSWVTGDLMLTTETTLALLDNLHLATGNANIDGVLASTVRLYLDDIRSLLEARDRRLAGCKSSRVLKDESLEVLSELAIDVDEKLTSVLAA